MRRNVLARFANTFCLLAAFAGFAVVQSVNSIPEVNAGVQEVHAITIPQTAILSEPSFTAKVAAPVYDAADNWNYPNDNYFKCVNLKNPSAPLRYEDFSLISASGGYRVTNNLTYDGPYNLETGYCQSGQVRLDAKELLQTTQGRIYLHKGGQGYTNSRTPYGFLWIGDLPDGTSPSTLVPASQPPEYGAPSAILGTNSWDWDRRNGRGCTPDGIYNYYMHIVRQGTSEELPSGWQYKPYQTSSRYNKYADAGPEQAEGTEHYAYLLWSWLTKGDGVTKSPGGGMVRALVKEGQTFYRCGVASIDSIAYAPDSATEVGRVTAIYGKTRSSAGGPWVYGWTIHSHRARNSDGTYGARVFHVSACPNTGC